MKRLNDINPLHSVTQHKWYYRPLCFMIFTTFSPTKRHSLYLYSLTRQCSFKNKKKYQFFWILFLFPTTLKLTLLWFYQNVANYNMQWLLNYQFSAKCDRCSSMIHTNLMIEQVTTGLVYSTFPPSAHFILLCCIINKCSLYLFKTENIKVENCLGFPKTLWYSRQLRVWFCLPNTHYTSYSFVFWKMFFF